MKGTSSLVAKDLARLGDNLTRWRKISGLTARLTAERAGISTDTLRAIEHGTGSPSLENVMRVLRVLGRCDAVLNATEPLNDDYGRMVANRALPKRVRLPR
jgi:transcriptional regulator with XRE-family HTH domain